MDGLGGHYAEWNKTKKDKYRMISLICGIWKWQQTSEYNNNKESRFTGTENKLVVTIRERKEERYTGMGEPEVQR